MLPGDRMVCAFVTPVKAGTKFVQWPLHVTIVPWFRLDDASEIVALGLEKALAGVAPFWAAVSGETKLGPKRNRPAQLLTASELSVVETKVRNYLHKKWAWLVDETTKAKRDFLPHVTEQRSAKLAKNKVYFEYLYIVQQYGTYKNVEAVVELGHGQTTSRSTTG